MRAILEDANLMFIYWLYRSTRIRGSSESGTTPDEDNWIPSRSRNLHWGRTQQATFFLQDIRQTTWATKSECSRTPAYFLFETWRSHSSPSSHWSYVLIHSTILNNLTNSACKRVYIDSIEKRFRKQAASIGEPTLSHYMNHLGVCNRVMIMYVSFFKKLDVYCNI